MSDFWAKALGNPVPAAPAAPAPVSTDLPWYQTVHQPTQQVVSPQPVQQEVVYVPAKAPSARSTEQCPNCFSGNYTPAKARDMARCFDCGYNGRFDPQSGATGMPTSDSGPAQPARQIAGAHAGYSGAVVDHV